MEKVSYLTSKMTLAYAMADKVARAAPDEGAAFCVERAMHNQFANGFYGSQQWKNCRRAFRNAKGGLCEACLAKGLITPGAEVHHKIPLTPEKKHPKIKVLSIAPILAETMLRIYNDWAVSQLFE